MDPYGQYSIMINVHLWLDHMIICNYCNDPLVLSPSHPKVAPRVVPSAFLALLSLWSKPTELQVGT